MYIVLMNAETFKAGLLVSSIVLIGLSLFVMIGHMSGLTWQLIVSTTCLFTGVSMYVAALDD